MHPYTDELLHHLDANRAVLRAAVDGIPPHLRETRPTPNQWSVAEVLEHLTRVEEQITRFLASKLSEAKAAGQLYPQSDTSPIAGSLDHEAILDRRRAITAGERVLPRGGMDWSAALTALDASRVRLRELVTSMDGIALERFTLPHPVLGVINGYQWFLFIGSHEARHAAQIREIATVLSPGDRRDRVQAFLRSAERTVTRAADGLDSAAAVEVAGLLADVERETPGGAPLHSQLDTVRKWVDALTRPDEHVRFGGSTHVRDHVIGQLRQAQAAADDYFRETR